MNIPNIVSSNISSDQASADGINSAFGGNRYFTAENKESKFLGVNSSPYTTLRPIGNGVVDVYKDMYWSNMGNKSEVPQIFIVEKQLQYGAWATQLSNLLLQGSNMVQGLAGAATNAFTGHDSNTQGIDSFVQLYNSKPTGFCYNLPWLLKHGDGIRSIENQWTSAGTIMDMLPSTTTSSKAGAISNMIGAGVGAAIGAMTPGFGFEDTKQYSSTSQQSLTITFPLYNTLDLEMTFNHFSFINLFTFQNLKTRTSLMSYIPPKLYQVDAYSIGGIYMAAAYVSNFKVDSIGTTRRMKEWSSFGAKEILIPEAYRVTITFTDLLSQSSNVFAGTLGGTKIKVTNASSLAGEVVNLGTKVGAGLGEMKNAVKTGVGL